MCFFTGALTTFLYFDIIHYYSMISNYNGLMNIGIRLNILYNLFFGIICG